MSTFRDEWRTVVVDEDDFRLACHLVWHWRQTSDGSDLELVDRIAAAITHTRTTAHGAGRREGAQEERNAQRVRGDLCRWCHRERGQGERHGEIVAMHNEGNDPEVGCLGEDDMPLPFGYPVPEVPF